LILLLAEGFELCALNAGRTAGRIAAEPAAFRKLRRLSRRSGSASLERDCLDMINLNITFPREVATAHLSAAGWCAPDRAKETGMTAALSERCETGSTHSLHESF